MAAITGPGGPFVAAMVGPRLSWIAITGPLGPTVGGTSLRVTGLSDSEPILYKQHSIVMCIRF